jgi:protein-S-isoprenylcysteine O-methyltransferase Ste14
MGRVLAFLYGLFGYALFLVTILYAIAFVANFDLGGRLKTIDSGAEGPLGLAILANVGILFVFAVQHAIMARPEFKERWTKIIPRSIERSTFVIIASAILLLLFWQWRPLPAIVWSNDNPVVVWVVTGISMLGWATVFYATFLIDHFDLFGMRQVVLPLMGKPYSRGPFVERSLYKWIRHPLMTGFLIAFWFTPVMTQGHLLFAIVTTGYILVGVKIEERDLIRAHPDEYLAYKKRTPSLIPRPWKRRGAVEQTGTARSA